MKVGLILFSSAGLTLLARLVVTALVNAPVECLMGISFPGRKQWVLEKEEHSSPISSIWAVFVPVSAMSSVLAALLVLSFGFDWVFRIGAMFYTGAWLVIIKGAQLIYFLYRGFW
jgi:hypothetical protein